MLFIVIITVQVIKYMIFHAKHNIADVKISKNEKRLLQLLVIHFNMVLVLI